MCEMYMHCILAGIILYIQYSGTNENIVGAYLNIQKSASYTCGIPECICRFQKFMHRHGKLKCKQGIISTFVRKDKRYSVSALEPLFWTSG